MQTTQTQELLANYDGKVTHAAAVEAGGVVYDQTINYTFFDLPDGSKIAVYRVPFDSAA